MALDQWVARLKMFPWPKSGYRLSWGEFRETRSLTMNSFQHVIYKTISDFLISHGKAECTPEFVKRALKNKYLGWTQEEFVDIASGECTVHEVLRHTSTLDAGEAYHFTSELLSFADAIGCEIRIPAKSEYREMADKQEE